MFTPPVTALRSAALLAVLGLGCACGAGADDATVVTVFAASSLTEALGELAEEFETANPGTRVRLNFAGSQILRLQLEQGAAADVFASANPDHVAALNAAELVGPAEVFAHNELALIVPVENPAQITAFDQLTRARRLVVAEPNVPAGRYTRELLRRANEQLVPGFGDEVLSRVVSEELNVRLVRAKVELGEADAAIVYMTDAESSGQVLRIDIPPAVNVRADYSVCLVADGRAGEAATRFVEFMLSDTGQAVLLRWGFGVE